MKLKTDYLGYDCTIFIYNGMVSKILCDLENKQKGSFTAQPEGYLLMQPKKKAEFNFYKLPQEKTKEKYKYNYELEYENENNSKSTINVKLSSYKLAHLKWQKIIYWFSKTDNYMRFFTPIITGVITYLITRMVYGC